MEIIFFTSKKKLLNYLIINLYNKINLFKFKITLKLNQPILVQKRNPLLIF